MADNKVAEAFIELRADTKAFDTALKSVSAKLKKGIDLELDTKGAEKKIKAIQNKLEKGLKTTVKATAVSATTGGAAGSAVAAGAAGAAAGVLASKQKELAKSISLTNIAIDLNAEKQRVLIRSYNAATNALGQYVKTLRAKVIVEKASRLGTQRSVSFLNKSITVLNKATTASRKFNQVLTKQRTFSLGQYTALFTSIVAIGKSALTTADRIDNLSTQFDLSAASIQSLSLLAERAGLSFETIGEAVNKLRRVQAEAIEGNRGFIANFQELGVTLADLETLNTEDLLAKVGKALKENGDSANVAVAGSKLLGEQFVKIQGVLAETSVGLDAVNADFIASGQILSNAYVAAGDSLEEDLTKIGTRLKIFAKEAAIAIGTLGGLTADFKYDTAQLVTLEDRVKATANLAAEEEKVYRVQQLQGVLLKARNAIAAKYERVLANAYNRTSGEFEQTKKIIGGLKEQSRIASKRQSSAADEKTAIEGQTESYTKQLSIIERINSSLQKTDASSLSDAFQRSLLSPAVSTTEAKLTPVAGNESFLREQISSNDRQVARLEEVITEQTKMLDALNTQTEVAIESRDKLSELVTAYGQGALFN